MGAQKAVASFVKKSIKKVRTKYMKRFRKDSGDSQDSSDTEPLYESITTPSTSKSTSPFLTNRFKDDISSDSGITDFSSPLNSSRKTKKLQFSADQIIFFDRDTSRLVSESSISSDEPMNSSTPLGGSDLTVCKVRVSETPEPQKVVILERRCPKTSKVENESPEDVMLRKCENRTGWVYEEKLVASNQLCSRVVEKTPSNVLDCGFSPEKPRTINDSLLKDTIPLVPFLPDANSTSQLEILSNNTKEGLNLIHNTHWTNLEDHQKSSQNEDTIKPGGSIEEKFIVNIFESRSSKRWQKHGIRVTDLDEEVQKLVHKQKKNRKNLDSSTKTLEDAFKTLEHDAMFLEREARRLEREASKVEEESRLTKYRESDEYKRYRKLKKERDVECVKMTQASKALQELRKHPGRDWCDELVAEKILLETDEKVKLLTQKISDNTYTLIKEPSCHNGTIQLSDVKFPLKTPPEKVKEDRNYTEFFVMTVSYDTHLLISNFVMQREEYVSFNHSFTFGNIESDFELKLKLFCVKLRTAEENFLEKFSCNFCPTSRIIYEDINTRQLEEKTVLKPTFKLFGEATLTKNHINDISTTLKTTPINLKTGNEVNFSLKVTDICLQANLKGFLDVGKRVNELFFWERKWCVLKGPNFHIFNYPQDEDLGKPVEQINLEYCFGPIITKVINCPKRRSFQLKTGRPCDISRNNVNNVETLKTKPNFALQKFYFAAENAQEYAQWTQEVESILNSLSDWQKLVFSDEYIEYMRL